MIIAVNLHSDSIYSLGIMHGIFRYVRNRPDIKLWLPNASVINQEAPEHIDGMIGCLRRIDLPNEPPHIINVNSFPKANTLQVCTDSTALCKMALNYFRSCGLNNVCFLNNDNCPVSAQRLETFSEQAESLGLSTQILRIRKNEPSTLDQLSADLETLPKPTGILLFDDSYASRLSKICRKHKLRIPEDVALLGINNDIDYCLKTQPTLSSISLDQEMIGYVAAEALVKAIKGESVNKINLVAPKELIERESSGAQRKYSLEVRSVLDYMNARFSEPIVMDDLVRQQSLGRRALEKAFQAELGESPMQQLRSIRLQQIRHLLKTSDKTVTDIGRECGIPDANYLCKIFKKTFGSTPTEFRTE